MGESEASSSADTLIRRAAEAYGQRTDELRRHLARLQRELQGRLEAEATLRVVVDGEGEWYLNLKQGRMTVSREPAEEPLLSVYHSALAWRALAARGSSRAGSPVAELTRSRIERLRSMQGAIEFRVTDLEEGGEAGIMLQLGRGPRPTVAQSVVTLRAEDARRLRTGEMVPQQAFLQGLLRLSGDVALAMRVGAALLT